MSLHAAPAGPANLDQTALGKSLSKAKEAAAGHARSGGVGLAGTPDNAARTTPIRPTRAEAYTPERSGYAHASEQTLPGGSMRWADPKGSPAANSAAKLTTPPSKRVQATRRRLTIDEVLREPVVPIKQARVAAERPIHEIVGQLDSELESVVVEAMETMQVRFLNSPQHVREDISVSGAVEKLVARMSRGGPMAEKAIATLQNLSAEVKADDSIKQVMVNCGLLSQLQSMIENRVCTAKAIATLMNLSIGSDERKRQIVDRGAVASLVPLMAHANIEERFLAVNVLTSLAINSNDRKHAIASTHNVISTAIKLAEAPETPESQGIRLNSLELIQSLILGSNTRKKSAADAGLIQCLTKVLIDDQSCPATTLLASQLLKGFADYLGRVSTASTGASASAGDAWSLQSIGSSLGLL